MRTRRMDKIDMWLFIIDLRIITLMKLSSPSKEYSGQYQSSQQQYEQEFWKLKAQRLQAKNEELARQVQSLLKRLVQAGKKEEILNEKIALLERNENAKSRKKDPQRIDKQNIDKSNEQSAQEEIERLGKEIRALKNGQSLELTKATDQCKKLKKKITDLQTKLHSSISNDDHASKVRALTEQASTLAKKLSSSELQLGRVREEKKKLLQENDLLRKDLQVLHAKAKAAEKQEEENLIDRRKYEKFMYQYKSEKQDAPFKKDEEPRRQGESLESQEISSLKQTISNLQKERQKDRKMLLEMSSWENQKARAQLKLRETESDLAQTKDELKNVLSKLAPLISHKQQYKGKQGVQERASLTLLEIFLKRYKIQAF